MRRTFTVSDVVQQEFLRFPTALLANPQYKAMSCEAKIVYMMLLNRMTLSQRSGWVNGDGEVYLIMTREEAAALLNIGYKKMIAVFRELTANALIREQRQGRGYPNLIYVLKTGLEDGDAAVYDGEWNVGPEGENGGEANGAAGCAVSAVQGLSNRQVKDYQNDSSRAAKMTVQELAFGQSSKIENSYIENSEIEKEIFDRRTHTRACADDGEAEMLEEVFDRCELYIYGDDVRLMFENAIERLYYSREYHIGGAILPNGQIRKHLLRLDADMVSSAYETIRQNEKPVRNTTAYLMSVLFNCINEAASDLIVGLPPEYLKEPDG